MSKLLWQTETTSADETETLAARMGAQLRGGEVIELVSDLGGGKTTFVRGLMRGLGSADVVASPTFTISKMYMAGKLEVHHFDFYRLQEAGIIADEVAEVVGQPHTITVVEWADVVQHVLPGERLTITIAQTPMGTREFRVEAPESYAYIIEAGEQR